MTCHKNQLILFICLCFLWGCTPSTESTNQLSISKEEICLQFGGNQQCVRASGTFRLTLKDGKPMLEALDLGRLSAPSFPQYNAPVAIKAEKLGVIIENKVLSLQNGEQTLKDSTGLGFLIQRSVDGAVSCMASAQPKLGVQTLKWDQSRNPTGERPTVQQMQFSADVSETYMTLSRIHFGLGDAAMHMIPNDTGTEVVIIDNFHVVGDCNAEVPDECCSAAESAGPPVTVNAEMVSEYAADGLRLLACFAVNSICTFTDGDKLIVYDCVEQKRYCLDYSICDVVITTTDAGVCISVPSTCEIENPFL